ncbi:MAG TPA: ORF6N domain-containing protein, partial [Chthoniobacterales bacterium]|nr:ORF6N domain-containing protein [Chthoniobacterales bacterium]
MISLLDHEAGMAVQRDIKVVEQSIHLIRGLRVMLDSDLAKVYGVSTKQLNQQVRRNLSRFPSDFAFQLTASEFTNLRSQIVTSSYGGRRYSPWAFTEHGAIMLASVLNSEVAIEASLRVVRAFVRLREMISANAELARKFAELERRLDTHDAQLAQLFAAIRQLLAPAPEKKREIGFHVKEKAARYRGR